MQLKSIFTNSFGILFSRVTGLGRDVLMASALGASIWSDMFFVAFKLPNHLDVSLLRVHLHRHLCLPSLPPNIKVFLPQQFSYAFYSF
jgi:peptidoglycan biosynthesis protein MviN/MurJ (putative lipid II flippase)